MSKRRKLSRGKTQVLNNIEFKHLETNQEYIVVPNKDIGYCMNDDDDDDYKAKILVFEGQDAFNVYFRNSIGTSQNYEKTSLLDEHGNTNIWTVKLPSDISRHIYSFFRKSGKPKKRRKTKKRVKPSKK